MTLYVQPRAGWLYPPSTLDEDADGLYLRPAEVEPSKRPARDLLERFCDLADYPDKVTDFVREYGGLQLCEHDLPCSHNIPALGDRSRKPCMPKLTSRDDGALPDAMRSVDTNAAWVAPGEQPTVRSSDFAVEWWAFESRAAWQQLTNEVASLVQLIDAVADGDESETDYLAVYEQVVTHYEPGTFPLGFTPDEESAAVVIDWLIERWLKLGDVRLRYAWDERRQARIVCELAGEGLAGAVAVQLAGYAVQRFTGSKEGTAVCSECGEPYSPLRAPRRDRDNFCDSPDCRNRAAWRRAQRRRRQKIRQHKQAKEAQP